MGCDESEMPKYYFTTSTMAIFFQAHTDDGNATHKNSRSLSIQFLTNWVHKNSDIYWINPDGCNLPSIPNLI